MQWSWLVPCLPLALAAAAVADDGAPMVAVPGATFQMGSPGKAIDEDRAEAPVHPVTVAAFEIDKYEVTCALYAKFLNAVKTAAAPSRCSPHTISSSPSSPRATSGR